ncbi:uncharacterized protein LOC128473701 [Spea bombifrons]|uniref:uncharacterized protein LOC128473701 n=1 Tax=Spea bombifrons TaxID=233779 RepID=UPI00234A5483|nr:uncharacterized protein LOC128473701 [Spea bombifrons]
MMGQNFRLWLFAATFSTSFADITSYVPQVTGHSVRGNITATTFVLDLPQCIFNGYNASDVWLVIAENSVAGALTDEQLSIPVQYSSSKAQGYYHFQPLSASNYPCSDSFSFTRVGDDARCTNSDYCNGPLNTSLSYSVKFVAWKADTAVVGTKWSPKIKLMAGKDPSTIDTWPGRRSGGMIVITSILSILLAAFLACLIASVIIRSGNLSTKFIVESGNRSCGGTPTEEMLSPLPCLLATVFLVGHASAQAIANFNPSAITAGNIPSFFNFSSNLFYLTLGTPVNTLICVTPTSGINLLRIGNDINCIFNLGILDCNGPLNPEFAYRFKFVVTNENGTIVAQSEWSAEIFLNRARPFSSIDTQVKHGAGMIVITSILPVFLAFIFAFLSAILISNCCCIKVSSTQVDVSQHT